MPVTISGSGPITGLTSIASPTTLNGLTIPTTGFGKVLQVVRATDTTQRSTTSVSYADVTGMSVTITPQKNDSAILIVIAGRCTVDSAASDGRGAFRIVDSSNNTISGSQDHIVGSFNTTLDIQLPFVILAWATPATTSSVTYKLQFATAGSGTNFQINNNLSTGQVIAIEVSA